MLSQPTQWHSPKEQPEKNQRIIVFSADYEVGETLRFRIIEERFLKTLEGITLWAYCEELIPNPTSVSEPTPIQEAPPPPVKPKEQAPDPEPTKSEVLPTKLEEITKNLAARKRHNQLTRANLFTACQELELDFKAITVKYDSMSSAVLSTEEGMLELLTSKEKPEA